MFKFESNEKETKNYVTSTTNYVTDLDKLILVNLGYGSYL